MEKELPYVASSARAVTGTLHLIQRENKQSACFFAEEDYLFYLGHHSNQARKNDCAIPAWCLMTNHVHLLLTPVNPESIGMLMKGPGQRYVQYINRTYPGHAQGR